MSISTPWTWQQFIIYECCAINRILHLELTICKIKYIELEVTAHQFPCLLFAFSIALFETIGYPFPPSTLSNTLIDVYIHHLELFFIYNN